MSWVDWKRIVRAVKVLGTVLALTMFGALVADDVHQRDTSTQLVVTQRRQRPITDYNTAFFSHLDCIKAYEVRFFADIADASTATPEQREAARELLVTDRDALRATFTVHCPAPDPPTFDNDGNLVKPPVVREQRFP